MGSIPAPAAFNGIADSDVRALLSECAPDGFLCGFVAYRHAVDPAAPLVAHLGAALALAGAFVPRVGSLYTTRTSVAPTTLHPTFVSALEYTLTAAMAGVREGCALAGITHYTVAAQRKPAEMGETLETDPRTFFLLPDGDWPTRGSRLPGHLGMWWGATMSWIRGGTDGGVTVPLQEGRTPRPTFVATLSPATVARDRTETGWPTPLIAHGLLLGCPGRVRVPHSNVFAAWEQGGQAWALDDSATNRLGAILHRRSPLAGKGIVGGVDPDPDATSKALATAAREVLDLPHAPYALLEEVCHALLPLWRALVAVLACDNGYHDALFAPGLWGVSPALRLRATRILSWHLRTAYELATLAPPTETAALASRVLRYVGAKNGITRSALLGLLVDVPPKRLEETLQAMLGVTLLARSVAHDPGEILYVRKGSPAEARANREQAPSAPPTAHGMGVVQSPSAPPPAPTYVDDGYDDEVY